MALTVGTDTYISQADATTYVSNYYATTSAKYIAWAALTSDNKDAYLRSALLILERQPFAGLKVDLDQTLSFPRALYTDVQEYNYNALFTYGENWYEQSAVPDSVKYAQVEIALYLLEGVPKRVELQRQGVKSFSLGNLSENYGSGKNNKLPYEAKELLSPYLAGSVRIC